MNGLIAFLTHWKELIMAILVVGEIIARLTPTAYDDSIISWIVKLINWLVPNRSKKK